MTKPGLLSGKGARGALPLLVGLMAAAATACASAGTAGGAAGVQSAGAAAASAARPVAPGLGRTTFDSVWNQVNRTYYDTTFGGLDWRGVHAELAPAADTVSTMGDLRELLGGMLTRLGESHLGIIPGEAVPERGEQPPSGAAGYSGIVLRLVDGEVLVARVDSGSPAERAGVRPGWKLLRTTRDTAAVLMSRVLALEEGSTERREAATGVVSLLQARLRYGTPGDTVRAVFADGSDAEVESAIELGTSTGSVVQFGNLPPMLATLTHRRLATAGSGCISYVHLGIWMPVAMPALERAVDSDSMCAGLVLDLRGNPGGVAGLVMRIGGLLLDEPTHLGTMQTRTSTLRFAVTPRRVRPGGELTTPYAGNVALLVDEFSMSTSEIVAASLQEVGRVRVFGTPTPGLALPAGMVRLPTGDVLLHVVADYRTPAGRRVEHEGVIPDEEVPLRRAELLEGRDAALEAAVAWISAAAVSG